MNKREVFFKILSDPKISKQARNYIPKHMIKDLDAAIKSRKK